MPTCQQLKVAIVYPYSPYRTVTVPWLDTQMEFTPPRAWKEEAESLRNAACLSRRKERVQCFWMNTEFLKGGGRETFFPFLKNHFQFKERANKVSLLNPPSTSKFLCSYLFCEYMVLWVLACHRVNMGGKEHLVEVGSLLLQCGFWGLNPGCHTLFAASIFTHWAILPEVTTRVTLQPFKVLVLLRSSILSG